MKIFLKKTKNLNVSNASQESDIPTKILIENIEYFSFVHKNINYCLEQSLFPHDLKLADVAPVYKTKSKSFKFKDDYRPIGILSNISKEY